MKITALKKIIIIILAAAKQTPQWQVLENWQTKRAYASKTERKWTQIKAIQILYSPTHTRILTQFHQYTFNQHVNVDLPTFITKERHTWKTITSKSLYTQKMFSRSDLFKLSNYKSKIFHLVLLGPLLMESLKNTVTAHSRSWSLNQHPLPFINCNSHKFW